jgi:hypothetical protein
MNYEKIYNQIIEKAKLEQDKRIVRKKNGEYFEGHHIIPVCLGGKGNSNDWFRRDILKRHENIVGLTAREHFICHKLLAIIYPNNKKLIGALWRMLCKPRDCQYRYIPNSKEYQYYRELYVDNHHNSTESSRERCSNFFKQHNPMKNGHKEETKSKISESMTGKIIHFTEKNIL